MKLLVFESLFESLLKRLSRKIENNLANSFEKFLCFQNKKCLTDFESFLRNCLKSGRCHVQGCQIKSARIQTAGDEKKFAVRDSLKKAETISQMIFKTGKGFVRSDNQRNLRMICLPRKTADKYQNSKRPRGDAQSEEIEKTGKHINAPCHPAEEPGRFVRSSRIKRILQREEGIRGGYSDRRIRRKAKPIRFCGVLIKTVLLQR